MKANMVGDLLGDNIVVYEQHITDTTPFVSEPMCLDNLDGCSFQLITDGSSTLSGDYKVEVSNNYVSDKTPNLNQGQQIGQVKWSDITSQFSPSITSPAGSDTNQYVQAYPLVARHIRITFTPASGAGDLTITYSGKGNR